VAGLICWGAELNPTVAGIDPGPCAVFDLQVIPNDDPSKGDTEVLREQELLVALETALQQHANEFKVWNLSLGTDTVCSLDEFSEFAEELDNLQEQYQVSFVISAGNFAPPPLLDYPRQAAHLQTGRITTPADSGLGIAVGSISHVDYKMKGPKQHEPSAFSRHCAGPNYVIKPDLIHYGGSCSTDATHVSGIRSINAGSSAENLGTSFATPLVARTLAQIYHQITPTPTPVLARALLTHHARDPRTQGRVPDGEENFFGFGLPAAVPYCLECSPFSSTLIFDDVLRPGYFLEWDDFPYPASLRRDGRYFGEVWMTVAFAPARGARWGSEYCETHIDAHFGVYRQQVARDTGEIKVKFEGLVPPEHKNPGVLYESYQVAHLRKWAPVRTYHGDLGEKGKSGQRWRLKVQLLSRHGIDDSTALKAQPFSLIITIADPQKRAPVYDEMARIVRNRFQSQNLAVRATARIRGRP
jgi:serine protease AprX